MAVAKNALKAGLKNSTAISNLQNTPLAAMMGVPANNQIISIPLTQLDPYPKQYLYSMRQEELEWLAENIAEVGVLQPIQVMLGENSRYTILAGHRRSEAAKLAGLDAIPAIVNKVDDATAAVIFHATNLGARQKLLPSEKAFAYQEIEQALETRGATPCRTTAAIAETTGENIRTIQRYKRLTALIPPLLKKVDDETLPLLVGVQLSYLSPTTQNSIENALEEKQVKTISPKSAQLLRENSQDLTPEQVVEILQTKKKARKEKQTFTIQKEKVAKYLTDATQKEFETTVLKALEEYCKP